MNPTSQYFWASALQSAINGINSSGLIGILSGVGYAVLLLSFLWGVYESFLQGGDTRGAVLSLLKYGVTTLILQNWSQVFQDFVNGFGDIAAAIIQHSANQDLSSSWTQQLQTYYAAQSSDGLANSLSALWHGDSAIETALINLLLLIVSIAIWPLCVEVFALFYALWGCVLYCVGPLVLALMPSMGFSRMAKSYIQNFIIWNMWVVLLAILWAMLWALNLTSVDTLLNTDGLLGFLQGVNATLLVSIATLLLSLCTMIIPFVAKQVLQGEFGPVGGMAVYLGGRAAKVIGGLFSGGASIATTTGAASSFGGMSSGMYGSGSASGYGGWNSVMGNWPQFAQGGQGFGSLSLPPRATPQPEIGTRNFPHNSRNQLFLPAPKE
jgi:hypothetical protein